MQYFFHLYYQQVSTFFYSYISSCLTIRFRQHFNDLFSVSEPTFAGFIV